MRVHTLLSSLLDANMFRFLLLLCDSNRDRRKSVGKRREKKSSGEEDLRLTVFRESWSNGSRRTLSNEARWRWISFRKMRTMHRSLPSLFLSRERQRSDRQTREREGERDDTVRIFGRCFFAGGGSRLAASLLL